jgi:hypothetical protein
MSFSLPRKSCRVMRALLPALFVRALLLRIVRGIGSIVPSANRFLVRRAPHRRLFPLAQIRSTIVSQNGAPSQRAPRRQPRPIVRNPSTTASATGALLRRVVSVTPVLRVLRALERNRRSAAPDGSAPTPVQAASLAMPAFQPDSAGTGGVLGKYFDASVTPPAQGASPSWPSFADSTAPDLSTDETGSVNDLPVRILSRRVLSHPQRLSRTTRYRPRPRHKRTGRLASSAASRCRTILFRRRSLVCWIDHAPTARMTKTGIRAGGG